MGQSAEELRRDIAGTREELGETLDAIGDRVSPGRMIERRKNRITNGARALKDRVMGTVDDGTGAMSTRASGAAEAIAGAPDAVRRQTQGSPLAAGGVAFGIGFLLAAAIPPSRREEQAAEQLLDKAEPVKEQLTESGKQVAGMLKESAAEAVEHVKQVATDGGREVADTAKDAARSSQDAVTSATEQARRDVGR